MTRYAVVWHNRINPSHTIVALEETLIEIDAEGDKASAVPIFTSLDEAQRLASTSNSMFRNLEHYVVEVTVVTGKRV